jgi:hypothetical protein
MLDNNIEIFFVDKFKTKPSIHEFEEVHKSLIEQIVSKSYVLWYHKKFIENKNYNFKVLYEYDSSGILIYTELKMDDYKNIYKVFILSLSSKQNIVEFVINTIKKNI